MERVKGIEPSYAAWEFEYLGFLGVSGSFGSPLKSVVFLSIALLWIDVNFCELLYGEC